MQYMLLIYGDESAWHTRSEEESGQIMRELERAWDQIKALEQERNEARNQIAELTRELAAQKEAWQGYRGQRPGTMNRASMRTSSPSRM